MKKLLQSLFILMFIAGSAIAQDRTITGTVTDQEDGKPLPGVTVRIKGTKVGTQTSGNGKYSLALPAGTTSIEFAYLGYLSQSRPVGAGDVINVALASDSKALTEVVVVGYGTKKLNEVNGAQATIKGSDIADQPVESFDKALSGKAAGVQISSAGGTLGDGVSIRVRGVNSISTSSLPLIVIDGIPTSTIENVSVFNGGNGTRFDPLALINPNDIESIEVLKDAGAAVLYGSRAANGVILVTTKKGKQGTSKITVSSKLSFSNAASKPDVLGAEDFMTINNEKVKNKFGATAPVVAVESDIDGDGVPDRTNWMNEIFQTGTSYDNNLSLSGGSEKATYYASARYIDQKGILYGNRLKTGSARLNLDVKPKTWLRSGIELSFTKTKNYGLLTDNYLAGTAIAGYNAFPTVPVFNPNGPKGYNLTTGALAGYLGLGNNITVVNGTSLIGNRIYNPIATIDLQRNQNTPQHIVGNVYMEASPIPGLKVTSKFGIDYLSNFEDQYSTPLIAGLGQSFAGLVQDNFLNNNLWVWQNFASYDKTFAEKHRISLIAGAEYQYTKRTELYASANNFADPFFQSIIDGTFTSIIPGTENVNLSTGGRMLSNGLESYFGRAGYTFDDKYFIEGAFRADAYSGFGINNQWGKFPSISAGWVASQESFLKDNKVIDYLKFRGSYGLVGNSRGVGSYAARTLYSGGSYTSLNGFSSSQIGNPNLKWEASKKFNVGFDMNFLDKRIGLVVDYFNTNVSDLILAAPVLYSTGVPGSTITTNIGSMRNRGIELTLNTVNIKNDDFSWSTSFNYTHVKNKVLTLVSTNNNADILANAAVASVGRALGTYKLYNSAGVDPKTGYAMWYAADGTTRTWDQVALRYVNADGSPAAALTATDQQYQEGKTGTPTFYGGMDNTFRYKDFDFNFSIVYQGGNYLYNATLSGLLTNSFQNNESRIMDRWTTPGQNTDIPRLSSNDNVSNQASTRFLEKGDFLRMRAISLGYNLKPVWAEKAGLSNLRLSAQLYNAFVITGYSGIDPEVNSNRNNSNIATGYDNRAIPQPRTFTLGLNASF
ncbi:TonB-dependent receptor [Pedobacter sp. PLR]|uniref:SusC/RagA family TonB-linked outer membrane protein n=1 Tax=Pedobacter sp. PLR TaxID=2994465 RepID=UPI002246FB12|nr:TonB-dependent receptor [Pedobacter sp. PLR]MCX2453015.1 TonB-dependent receptor [Pedobacter sp. PLR]